MVFTEEQKCELRLRILVNGEKASNIAAEFGMTVKSFQQALSSKKSSKKTVKQSYNHIHGVEISRKNGESLTRTAERLVEQPRRGRSGTRKQWGSVSLALTLLLSVPLAGLLCFSGHVIGRCSCQDLSPLHSLCILFSLGCVRPQLQLAESSFC